jgi:transposase
MVIAPESLTNLNAQKLREMVTGLIVRIGEHDRQIVQRDETIARKDREILYRQTKIDQLTHEMAVLKRWKFGRSREQLDQTQASLLDEAIDADIAAIELELQTLAPRPPTDAASRQQPRRAALPRELPRVDQHHEPESTTCTMAGCGCTLKRIGEDVSEKLDYTPGLFTVERHIRGKWACA